MNEKEHDKEIGRWQQAIYDAIKEHTGADFEIDGAGCDSGDPLDFTLAEIAQGFGILQDKLETAENETARVKLLASKICRCKGEHNEKVKEVRKKIRE